MVTFSAITENTVAFMKWAGKFTFLLNLNMIFDGVFID